MTIKLKTRDVPRQAYENYLQRARECLEAAQDSFDRQAWNAAAINAIHACVAASDALCVFFLGKRYAGDDHSDVIRLLRMIRNQDVGMDPIIQKVSRILDSKHAVEYEERLTRAVEAEKILRDAKRVVEYVKEKLPV